MPCANKGKCLGDRNLTKSAAWRLGSRIFGGLSRGRLVFDRRSSAENLRRCLTLPTYLHLPPRGGSEASEATGERLLLLHSMSERTGGGGPSTRPPPVASPPRAPAPRKKRKKNDALALADKGERFNVFVELDVETYGVGSITIPMMKDPVTGFAVCLQQGCPNKKWCSHFATNAMHQAIIHCRRTTFPTRSRSSL